MPFKVLISDSLSKEAVDILQAEKEFKVDVNTKLTPEELKKVIKDYDALLVRSATKVTADLINAADKLKIIGRAGVGLDNVDVEAASKKGTVIKAVPESAPEAAPAEVKAEAAEVETPPAEEQAPEAEGESHG